MLIEYLPPVVQKIREMQEICKAEQPYFDEAKDEIEKILCRCFVGLADETGIARLEKVHGIIPGATETLEQRRVNILIRNIKKNISLSEVLTILFNYTVNVELKCDYNNDEAIIELKDKTTDIAIIYKALDEIAPLNIYIKEKLSTASEIEIAKSVFFEKIFYNYALGSWQLGQLNFGSRGEKTTIGGSSMNLQPGIFADIKETIAGDVSKIIVNDAVDIKEFTVSKTENSVVVNYHIRAADVSELKKVSFISANESEVATLNVDMHLDVDIELTQEFIIKEGTADGN